MVGDLFIAFVLGGSVAASSPPGPGVVFWATDRGACLVSRPDGGNLDGLWFNSPDLRAYAR